MKQLVISLKTSEEIFGDFKAAFRKAKAGKIKSPHYEISFDNKRDFDRFVRNLHLLSLILAFKPKSVYELSKIARIDTSNLNKIILFFEEIGAIRLEERTVLGRRVKMPVVEYDRIEFKLAS